MERVDAQVEEVHVAVALGHACEPPDLVVDAFHDAGADGVVEAAQYLPCVCQHGVGFEYPLLQILLCRLLAGLAPKLAQLLFEVVVLLW